MKKLFWTYRKERIVNPYTIKDVTFHWHYEPAMFLNNMFADWHEAGLTNLIDNLIEDKNYTSEIAPWIKKLTRFLVFEYNEEYVDPIELARSAENVGKRFDICIQTPEVAAQWLRENTNLEETSPNIFKLSEASVDMMKNEAIEAKLLDLN